MPTYSAIFRKHSTSISTALSFSSSSSVAAHTVSLFQPTQKPTHISHCTSYVISQKTAVLLVVGVGVLVLFYPNFSLF